ncbi:unnamed protein product [Meganyctiphanes norvegica]|uniref:Uncharacterized protein n=1 Tax=Meganyctiphanes norvegica TaxID=48144 RepID=A0AAV2R0Z1_MEGNR
MVLRVFWIHQALNMEAIILPVINQGIMEEAYINREVTVLLILPHMSHRSLHLHPPMPHHSLHMFHLSLHMFNHNLHTILLNLHTPPLTLHPNQSITLQSQYILHQNLSILLLPNQPTIHPSQLTNTQPNLLYNTITTHTNTNTPTLTTMLLDSQHQSLPMSLPMTLETMHGLKMIKVPQSRGLIFLAKNL